MEDCQEVWLLQHSYSYGLLFTASVSIDSLTLRAPPSFLSIFLPGCSLLCVCCLLCICCVFIVYLLLSVVYLLFVVCLLFICCFLCVCLSVVSCVSVVVVSASARLLEAVWS